MAVVDVVKYLLYNVKQFQKYERYKRFVYAGLVYHEIVMIARY